MNKSSAGRRRPPATIDRIVAGPHGRHGLGPAAHGALCRASRDLPAARKPART